MSYQPNQYELKLITSPTITIDNLSLIERNTITRLQFIVHNKHNFIKSTDYENNHLRILILSILIKIYESFSEQNQRRLDTFKSIIYSASLDRLIKDCGLLREQLGKVMAVQLKKMQIGFQAESYLLNMFNCVPFFDQIIVKAFYQYLGMKESIEQSSQSLQKLYKAFEEKFQLKIIWNKQLTDVSQSPDQVYLWRDGSQILRQSSLNMTFIGESSSQGSAHEICSRGSMRKKKRSKSKTVMLQTVSVGDSKSRFEFESTLKKNKQMMNQQTIQGFDYSRGKGSNKNINLNKKQINFSQVHLIKKSQPKRTFWNIICCSSQ